MTTETAQNTYSVSSGLGTRLAYGLGGVPVGVIQNGIAFFLLIYYNQVLGLDPALTALALSIALIADAITDPLVGFLSDNWTSRLGRRHPFLYLSAIPAGLIYYFVWAPPQLGSEFLLFLYLVVITILLRTCVTLFDVPHNALVAELSKDYHERTVLSSLKVSTLQFSGYCMVLTMYGIWLVPTETYPDGVLNVDGYVTAGYLGGFLITFSILLAALGLHGKVKDLRNFSHDASFAPSQLIQQFAATFKVSSFRIILLSGILSATGSGLFYALWAYLMNYFWTLTSGQTFFVLVANFIGAIIGSLTAPYYLTRQNKKKTAIELSLVFIVLNTAPYVLRLMDMFPANGTDLLLYTLLVHGVVLVVFVVWLTAVTASMTADIVEHGMVKGGYQNEGLIMAATTFTLKAGTAGGLIISGTILSLIAFPDQAIATTLAPETIANLGLYFAITTSLLYLISTLVLLGYRIDQTNLEEAIQTIESSR